jgi:hypothetical protein
MVLTHRHVPAQFFQKCANPLLQLLHRLPRPLPPVPPSRHRHSPVYGARLRSPARTCPSRSTPSGASGRSLRSGVAPFTRLLPGRPPVGGQAPGAAWPTHASAFQAPGGVRPNATFDRRPQTRRPCALDTHRVSCLHSPAAQNHFKFDSVLIVLIDRAPCRRPHFVAPSPRHPLRVKGRPVPLAGAAPRAKRVGEAERSGRPEGLGPLPQSASCTRRPVFPQFLPKNHPVSRHQLVTKSSPTHHPLVTHSSPRRHRLPRAVGGVSPLHPLTLSPRHRLPHGVCRCPPPSAVCRLPSFPLTSMLKCPHDEHLTGPLDDDAPPAVAGWEPRLRARDGRLSASIVTAGARRSRHTNRQPRLAVFACLSLGPEP